MGPSSSLPRMGTTLRFRISQKFNLPRGVGRTREFELGQKFAWMLTWLHSVNNGPN